MVVTNAEVYALDRSIRESKYPMAVNIDKCNSDITDRQHSLASAPAGSGHDNFLCGILVRFDLTFTIKAWTEAERYHWFEIVSSQSTMHRIAEMDYDKCMHEYVTDVIKAELTRLKDEYNSNPTLDNYLRLLYNCPVGLKLTAGMSTNYQQLKTIYAQRKTHRLPEWKEFCKWIESLPHSEFITG